jgi:hypothetical protein
MGIDLGSGKRVGIIILVLAWNVVTKLAMT